MLQRSAGRLSLGRRSAAGRIRGSAVRRHQLLAEELPQASDFSTHYGQATIRKNDLELASGSSTSHAHLRRVQAQVGSFSSTAPTLCHHRRIFSVRGWIYATRRIVHRAAAAVRQNSAGCRRRRASEDTWPRASQARRRPCSGRSGSSIDVGMIRQVLMTRWNHSAPLARRRRAARDQW